jgi:membrane protease YdiL (CAAX protease family)
MPDIAPWRLLLPALLALAAAWGLDAACARRGLLPPGFRNPVRRALGFAAVALVFFRGVFLPLGLIGLAGLEVKVAALHPFQLFFLHLMMVGALLTWFLAGYAVRPGREAGLQQPAAPELLTPVSAELLGDPFTGAGGSLDAPAAEPDEAAVPVAPPPLAPPRRSLLRRFAEQFGFAAPDLGKELGLGVVLGIAAWLGVLAVAMALGLALYALGGEELLPKRPPDVVPWIAALPITLRLLLSVSAGVVEETFFRGFLQPRIGLLASTALFALAHASYGQPFLLVGVTLLSLIYGLLVRWRQSIWAAITAHVLFDAVQLLVVIPAALKMIQKTGAG